jgi:hypothetical protein
VKIRRIKQRSFVADAHPVKAPRRLRPHARNEQTDYSPKQIQLSHTYTLHLYFTG